MALISLNGPDEPHLGPPHPQGPRSPFQLSCEGAHSPPSCYSELSCFSLLPEKSGFQPMANEHRSGECWGLFCLIKFLISVLLSLG